MSKNRLLITQSLLSSWEYLYKSYDGKEALSAFMRVLNRGSIRQNQKMLDGIQFENMVTAYCDGNLPPSDHKWRDGIIEVGEYVKGSQFQVAAYKDTVIDGIPFLLYGRLDGLRASRIFDIKFSTTYQPGKYLDSPQHSMYFACAPEAKRFDYVIYTGKEVCIETYLPSETPPIEEEIKHFIKHLEATGLDKIYTEKWRAK